jgi:hypothetical protein
VKKLTRKMGIISKKYFKSRISKWVRGFLFVVTGRNLLERIALPDVRSKKIWSEFQNLFTLFMRPTNPLWMRVLIDLWEILDSSDWG